LEEAITAWREVIRIAPGSSHAHYGLGAALTALEWREEAIAAFRAALEFKPDFALAYANLGVALRKQGRRAEAVAELHKARDLAPPGSELAGSIERELTEPFP
jgi:Flp pilus assembly protein TadD